MTVYFFGPIGEYVRRAFNGRPVPQRVSDGYVNGSALCSAAARPFAEFRGHPRTAAAAAELSARYGISVHDVIEFRPSPRPELSGSWVHPDLAPWLGEWVGTRAGAAVQSWVDEYRAGWPPAAPLVPVQPQPLVADPPGARSPFDAVRRTDDAGREYWSARDLMPMLGYDSWRRFEDSIDRAKAACRNTSAGNDGDHFAGAGKMIDLPKNAVREVEDVHLSRFACYLVAMNGDPRKPEIAAAQAYFAVQTRRAELGVGPAAGADLSDIRDEVTGIGGAVVSLDAAVGDLARQVRNAVRLIQSEAEAKARARQAAAPPGPGGVRSLSNAEKRRLAVRVVCDPDNQAKSPAQLSRECGLSAGFITRVRKEVISSRPAPEPPPAPRPVHRPESERPKPTGWDDLFRDQPTGDN